jgi:hypothetical protein
MRNCVKGMVIVLLGTSVLPGCVGRLVSEGLGEIKGPKGIFYPVTASREMSSPAPLADYTRFKVGPITDDFGGRVPPDLMLYLPGKVEEDLAKEYIPNDRGGKTLVIRGRIVHYEEEGAWGYAFGHFEEAVARLEMVDDATGKVLATANCIGRTTETVNRGTEKKAEGLAQAIVAWIKSYRGPPSR